jgi:hypothetical protein
MRRERKAGDPNRLMRAVSLYWLLKRVEEILNLDSIGVFHGVICLRWERVNLFQQKD